MSQCTSYFRYETVFEAISVQLTSGVINNLLKVVGHILRGKDSMAAGSRGQQGVGGGLHGEGRGRGCGCEGVCDEFCSK